MERHLQRPYDDGGSDRLPGPYSDIIEVDIPNYRLEQAKTRIQSLGWDGKETAPIAPDSREPPSGDGASPYASGPLRGISG